jgi:hypothetical protein
MLQSDQCTRVWVILGTKLAISEQAWWLVFNLAYCCAVHKQRLSEVKPGTQSLACIAAPTWPKHDSRVNRKCVGANVTENCECTVPGLITEEGALSKEVSLEEVVHLSGALRGGLVHHGLTLLDDVKQVPRITLHRTSTPLWVLSLHDCDCVICVSSLCPTC